MSHGNDDYEVTIGLEVHCQLLTTHKLFGGALNSPDAPANTQISPPDYGLPGALPVLNMQAVALATRAALALECTLNRVSTFDRKHYMYPDSPRGYQITQQRQPLCVDGRIVLVDEHLAPRHTVRITRIHLEDDAAKSTHEGAHSLIDFNRAGVPLIEIVSAPDMHSADDAIAYLRALHLLVTSLGICSGNMEQGAFRCDANVSVRRRGDTSHGERCELKNINSFKFIRDAIQVEARRQIEAIEAGEVIAQHTRQYDADTRQTRAMRHKESVADYRYMPDPDLPPLTLDDAYISQIADNLPELPDARRDRYHHALGISAPDALTLAGDVARATFFDAARAHAGPHAVLLASLVVQQWPSLAQVSPAHAAQLVTMLGEGVIHHTLAMTLLELMQEDERSPEALLLAHDLAQIVDPQAIRSILQEVLASNPRQLAEYRAGKHALIGFFMGQAMRATQGKADPVLTKSFLIQMLESHD